MVRIKEPTAVIFLVFFLCSWSGRWSSIYSDPQILSRSIINHRLNSILNWNLVLVRKTKYCWLVHREGPHCDINLLNIFLVILQVNERRLKSLSGFQTAALSHALTFPNVRRVLYSTCSIHKQVRFFLFFYFKIRRLCIGVSMNF